MTTLNIAAQLLSAAAIAGVILHLYIKCKRLEAIIAKNSDPKGVEIVTPTPDQ